MPQTMPAIDGGPATRVALFSRPDLPRELDVIQLLPAYVYMNDLLIPGDRPRLEHAFPTGGPFVAGFGRSTAQNSNLSCFELVLRDFARAIPTLEHTECIVDDGIAG